MLNLGVLIFMVAYVILWAATIILWIWQFEQNRLQSAINMAILDLFEREGKMIRELIADLIGGGGKSES